MTPLQWERFVQDFGLVSPDEPQTVWKVYRSDDPLSYWVYNAVNGHGYDPVTWCNHVTKVGLAEAIQTVCRLYATQIGENGVSAYREALRKRETLHQCWRDGQGSLKENRLFTDLRLNEEAKRYAGVLDLKSTRSVFPSGYIKPRFWRNHIAVATYRLPGKVSGFCLMREEGEPGLQQEEFQADKGKAGWCGNPFGESPLLVLVGDVRPALWLLQRAIRSLGKALPVVGWLGSGVPEPSLWSELETKHGIVFAATHPNPEVFLQAKACNAKVSILDPGVWGFTKLNSQSPLERYQQWVDWAQPWEQALEDAVDELPPENGAELLKKLFPETKGWSFLDTCAPSIKRKIRNVINRPKCISVPWRKQNVWISETGWTSSTGEPLCNMCWWIDTIIQSHGKTVYDVVARTPSSTWNFRAPAAAMDRRPLSYIRGRLLDAGGPLLVFEDGLQKSAIRLVMAYKPPQVLHLPETVGWSTQDGSILFPRFRLSRGRVEVLPDEIAEIALHLPGKKIRPPRGVQEADREYLDSRPSVLFWTVVSQAATHILYPATLLPYAPLVTYSASTLAYLREVEDAVGWKPTQTKLMDALGCWVGLANGDAAVVTAQAEPVYEYSSDALSNILPAYLEHFVNRRGVWLSSNRPRYRILSDLALWWEGLGGNPSSIRKVRHAVKWRQRKNGAEKACARVIQLLQHRDGVLGNNPVPYLQRLRSRGLTLKAKTVEILTSLVKGKI